MRTELVKNIYDSMLEHQFVVSYMGSFNQELLKSLISLTEKKLNHIEEDKSVKNKIFHFMIECVQNICRPDSKSKYSDEFMFLLGKLDNNYIIHSGGLFPIEESRELIDKINLVNNLNNDEVKDKFLSEIRDNEGNNNLLLMSFLDISKRTKSKIDYSLNEVNNEVNFLSFKTIVSK